MLLKRSPPMPAPIAYAAHTDAGLFLLDSEGVCQAFIPSSLEEASAEESGEYRLRREDSVAGESCVGAQYLASIDVTEPGAMIALPRVGATMLFGVVRATGRMALLRTGPLVRFESVEPGAAGQIAPSSSSGELSKRIVWDEESTASRKPTPGELEHELRAANKTPVPPPTTRPLPLVSDDPPTTRFRPDAILGATLPPESGPFMDEATPVFAEGHARRAVALEAPPRVPELIEEVVAATERAPLALGDVRGRR